MTPSWAELPFVLTVLTRGFRDLLLTRNESVENRVVRTLVPVSVRTAGERGTYNNRVSAMIAELPVGLEDPTERLHAIRAQMDDLKESKQAVADAKAARRVIEHLLQRAERAQPSAKGASAPEQQRDGGRAPEHEDQRLQQEEVPAEAREHGVREGKYIDDRELRLGIETQPKNAEEKEGGAQAFEQHRSFHEPVLEEEDERE